MKKEDFEGLKASVVEAGKIRRGEAPPSREFIREAHDQLPASSKVFAICVETDDVELLVPRKVYEIEITGECALVVDESGESAVYPAEFFVPVNLPVEVRQIIARLS